MRLGSFESALGVVGFVHVRSVHSAVGRRVHLGSLGGCRWIDSGAPCISSGSFRFNRARTGRRRVHSDTLCSFGRTLGVVGFVGFIRASPVCCWVRSVSFVSFARPLQVVSFIFLDSFGRALRFVGFIRARVGVVGFILVRWVHRRALNENDIPVGAPK